MTARIGGLTMGEGCALASLQHRGAWVSAGDIRAKEKTLERLLAKGRARRDMVDGKALWRAVELRRQS